MSIPSRALDSRSLMFWMAKPDMAASLHALDGPPVARPLRHAAVDHVEHLARAVAREQRGANARALAGGADHGHRRLGVQPLRELVQVVVRGEERAGDVARLPLVALAHVEDLELARVQLGHREAGGAQRRELL